MRKACVCSWPECPSDSADYLKKLWRALEQEDGAQLEACLSKDLNAIPMGETMIYTDFSHVGEMKRLRMQRLSCQDELGSFILVYDCSNRFRS